MASSISAVAGSFITASAQQSAADTQASAAIQAAQIQSNASKYATDTYWKMYDTSRSDMMPYYKTGSAALSKIDQFLGLDAWDSGAANTWLTSANSKIAKPNPADYGLDANGNIPATTSNATSYATTAANTGSYEINADGGMTWVASTNANANANASNATSANQTAYQAALANYNTAMNNAVWGSAANYYNSNDYGKYANGFSFSSNDFVNSNYYSYVQSQAANAIASKAAAGGMYGSGSMGTALVDYAQAQANGFYDTEYTRQYGQYVDLYNRYAAAANIGQTSASALSSLGQSTASGVANSSAYGANAMASGLNRAASAIANGTIGVGNSFTSGLENLSKAYDTQSLLDYFSNQTSSTDSYSYDSIYSNYTSGVDAFTAASFW